MHPTPRQKDVLDFIRGHIARNGTAPSYDEIAAHIGTRSKASISRIIGQLEERGQIRKAFGRSRSIELVHVHADWKQIITSPELRRAIEMLAQANKHSPETVIMNALRSHFGLS
jgi:SOS-response transcriptional repressor LexA